MPITHLSCRAAVEGIDERVEVGAAGYVCLANVHMLMEAADDRGFHDVLCNASMTVPDGMPVVWALRAMGYTETERVPGVDLTEELLEWAQQEKVGVGFYGGRSAVLSDLVKRVAAEWPRVRIAYAFSPPFRSLSEKELADHAAEINASGAQLLFVGMGCPKQERWMAANVGRVAPVMIGVGAVFDVLSGVRRRTPVLFQRLGLEWLLLQSS